MGAEERRIDEALRERLDEIETGYRARADRNEARIDHLTKWTFIILGILVAAQFALGGTSVYLVTQNSLRQKDINDAQLDIKRTVAGIQQQRIESIWDSCQGQNDRHDTTVARLNDLVDNIRDPVQKARANRSTAGTISLIDALAPHQNCTNVIKLRFGFHGKRLKRVVHRLTRDLGPPAP